MKTTIKQNQYELAVHYFNQQNLPLAKQHLREDLSRTPKSIPSLKLLAYIEYQTNNYQEALNHLEIINNIDGNIAEINNLIGSIFLKTQNFAKSIHFLSKAIENDGQYIDAYTNLIQALIATNQHQEAINTCKIAIEISPESTGLLQQYASLLFSVQQYSAAIAIYEKLLAFDKYSLAVNTGLAQCFLALKQPEKVSSILNALKDSSSKYPLIRLDVTNEYLNYGEFEKAITSYFEILNDVTDKAALYNNIASAYDHLNKHDDAITYFLNAISEDSQYIPALSNIGRVYTDILNFDDAEHYLSKALSIDCNNVNVIINMGRLQDLKKNLISSEKHFKKALHLDPNNTKALCNMGNIYHQQGKFEKSTQFYKTCLSIDPNYHDAEQNLGINELALGDFKHAWGHYFNRLRNLKNGETLSPITPGMSLTGKHVYFCRSQGIGDEIFFLRFLKILKQADVKITYRASKKLFPLLHSVSDIDNLLDEDASIPTNCDYYFTIDDIPLLLNIDHINKIPPPLLLSIDPEKLNKAKNTLLKYPPPYTAITWRAGTQDARENIKDSQRDLSKIIPFTTLKAMLKPINEKNGTVVIVQRNPSANELSKIENMTKQSTVDFSAFNDSLPDMLALLSHMDSYIGVSNTNTHLYAALNKKADVFIPFPPDWRWMAEGESTPWFRDFDLYRQTSDGNWNSAIEKLHLKFHHER